MTQNSQWLRIALCVLASFAAPATALCQRPRATTGPIQVRTAIPQAEMPSPRLSGFGIDTMGAVQSVFAAVVRGAPFSAVGTTEYTMVLADGTRINRSSHFTITRDREGRVRRDDGQSVWIADPVANAAYVLNPTRHVAERLPLRELAATDSTPSRPRSTSIRRDSVGHLVIDGVAADCWRTTEPIPRGAIGNDRPIEVVSVRCPSRQLQVLLSSQVRDPLHGDVSFRLIEIRTADPDPRLFSVPSGYRVDIHGKPKAHPVPE